MLLNGGPQYRHNPSISLFVTCDEESEVRNYGQWSPQGGSVMMDIGRYDWNPCYGQCNDRSVWELADISKAQQKLHHKKLFLVYFLPTHGFGLAQEAIEYYCNTMNHSVLDGIMHYPDGGGASTKTGSACAIYLTPIAFSCDGRPRRTPFWIYTGCFIRTWMQQSNEIDHYWEKLGEGGHYSQCGWPQDRYGVSWQNHTGYSHWLDERSGKSAQGYSSLSENAKFDIRRIGIA